MRSGYAGQLKKRFLGSENAVGRPIAIRDVAAHVGYSYEHVRQVLLGHPVGSRKFSDALCALAKLDSDAMWRLAMREKAVRRYGVDYLRKLMPPPDRRMQVLWDRLTSTERDQLVQIAEGFVARRAGKKGRSR